MTSSTTRLDLTPSPFSTGPIPPGAEPTRSSIQKGTRLLQLAEHGPLAGSPLPLEAGARIFEVLLGSWAQGLAREGSDDDWRGIFVAGPHAWGNPQQATGEERAPEDRNLDAVFWSQWRFAQLLSSGNYNALKLLYCDEALIVGGAQLLAPLRERREAFLSKETVDSLAGVAQAQGALARKLAAREKTSVEKEQWTQEKLPKLAAHSLRLARVAREAAQSGHFNLHRADAQELLAIKLGSVHWESVIAEADALAKAARSEKRSGPLPEKAHESLGWDWSNTVFAAELERRGIHAAAWVDQPWSLNKDWVLSQERQARASSESTSSESMKKTKSFGRGL